MNIKGKDLKANFINMGNETMRVYMLGKH